MNRLIHKALYRILPLESYLSAVSRLFFLYRRLGLGRHAPATEYLSHLPRLVNRGDVCIDIGANLGYYTRTLSESVGPQGRVYAVEPMPPVLSVLRRNLRRCKNVAIIPCALGAEERTVSMENDSAREEGYLGTGRNRVASPDCRADDDTDRRRAGKPEDADTERTRKSGGRECVAFEALMRRGSELFAGLERLDFIKCDVEGYEVNVMREMLPIIERFRPTVLIETGGENRTQIVSLFTRLGYAGFTLDRGREVPLDDRNGKDIIFRPEAGGSGPA